MTGVGNYTPPISVILTHTSKDGMMKKLTDEIDKYRIRDGYYASSPSDGMNGAFKFPGRMRTEDLCVISSDGIGWEHVSVSLLSRTPTWDEMCRIKDLFWNDDETVIQYHPAKKDYINQHPFCLHLWKPIGVEILTPPGILVGVK